MIQSCPNGDCFKKSAGLKFKHSGRYYRRSDSQWIRRYKCLQCRSSFSQATGSRAFGQNKRRVNQPLKTLLCSGVSMRRAALILKIHRKTVAQKLMFLAAEARTNQVRFLNQFSQSASIQFDDLETSVHSKCKPLSVTLAVDSKKRVILGFRVSIMPAKGHLAVISKKKYGIRPDHRPLGIKTLLIGIQKNVLETAEIKSDQNPLYHNIVKEVFPKATHSCVKGRRGCVAGQGELKKIGFDPLFSLNHTCAMLRANINRLIRRTVNRRHSTHSQILNSC